MGLEKIRHAVLSEAKAGATHIIDSAKKKNGDFLKSQKEVADQEFERLWKFRTQAIEDEYSRKLIQLQGAAGKQILDKRNILLKSLFERAKHEILDWPPAQYAKVMRRLVENAAENSRARSGSTRMRRTFFEKILSELNEGRGDAKNHS